MVNISADALRDLITDKGATMTELSLKLKHGNKYISNAAARGTMDEKDAKKLAKILGDDSWIQAENEIVEAVKQARAWLDEIERLVG